MSADPGHFNISAIPVTVLVVDLIVAMGYGGNRQTVAHRLGRSNDEGIDGVVNEDRLVSMWFISELSAMRKTTRLGESESSSSQGL